MGVVATQKTLGRGSPAPLAGVSLQAGTFQYAPQDDRMTWSDEMYGVLGFGVGEVVPTPALFASHQHPQDGVSWSRAIASVLTTGRATSLWHRIVTAGNKTRPVLTNLQAVRDGEDVVGVAGVMVDLTDQLRRHYASELTEAVERSARTRGLIERAKGVLMGALDIDEHQAFDTLRWHSSTTNVKLRDICTQLIEQLSSPPFAQLQPRQRVIAVLDSLDDRAAGVRPPGTPESRRTAGSETAVTAPPEPDEPAGGAGTRIPAMQLPETLVRAVAAAGISITIVDCSQPDWPLVYVNPAFEQLTGYAQSESLGRNCRFLQGDRRDPRQATAISTALANGEELRTTLLNVRKDGTLFFNELHLSAVRSAGGSLTHYIGYQSDVSEQVEREHHLERLAFRDAETGLPNRAAALRHLAGRISPVAGPRPGAGGPGPDDDPTAFGVFVLRPDRGDDRWATEPTPEPHDPDLDADAAGWVTPLARSLRSGMPDPAFVAALRDGAFVLVTSAPPDKVAATVRGALAQMTGPGTSGRHFLLGRAGHPGAANGPEDLLDAAEAAGVRLHPE